VRLPVDGKRAMVGSETMTEPAFERWIPLARQVVRKSLGLRWDDVFEIYTYVPTIPLAEALALEARRAGSDTHITLMTDDLWFTSMQELSTRWLRLASPVEYAIHGAITADVYLGGPADARRMRDIPPEKFDANAMGNQRQDEPLRKRGVRHVDLPIGRVTRERAEAYGLDYDRWDASYRAALAVDLKEIQRAGATLARSLTGGKAVHLTSDAGTDLRFETKPIRPAVDDGIIGPGDVRRGFVETSLPAGKVDGALRPESVAGEVHATDPIFFAGRTISGIRFRVKAGRVVDWSAEEHGELLDRALTQSKVGRARLGWFTIGLNPAALPCMLDNGIVRDDVGLGLGPHPQLERRAADPSISFYATIGPVRIHVGK
jgi:leucyl aminopeptidase (aminopeptidase T)